MYENEYMICIYMYVFVSMYGNIYKRIYYMYVYRPPLPLPVLLRHRPFTAGSLLC